jgi:hypothetical protein
LKQAAKTLIFLQEQGIDSYEDLKRKTAAASNEFESLSDKIKDADKKLKDIAGLQKQIGTYGKTRAVFDAYKRSSYDRAFYDANAADIILWETLIIRPGGSPENGRVKITLLLQTLKPGDFSPSPWYNGRNTREDNRHEAADFYGHRIRQPEKDDEAREVLGYDGRDYPLERMG